MTIVCLGEGLVDLIRREPPGPDGCERFETHPGGALANVAVAAARAGSRAALAGAIGDDEFGGLVRARLADEGVELDLLELRPELTTPFAFVRFDDAGEPEFAVHGDGIEHGMAVWAGRERELAAAASAVVVGSNTLVGAQGRAVTETLVAEARSRELPVLFDPNLRLRRWPSREAAVAACLGLVPRCTLVRTNLNEARLLAGAPGAGPLEAAEALVALGVPTAVVTDVGGAVASGAAGGAADAEMVADPSPIGAGDAFIGTLAAALEQADWNPEAMSGSLKRACAAAASACRRLGAID